MTNQGLPGNSPPELMKIAARHWKKLIACPLMIVAAGVLAMLYFPRTYRSEAQLFLRLGRESVGLDPTATTGQTISMQQGDRKDEVKSAIEVIKSRGVLAQVVDRLGPEHVLGDGGPGDDQRSPTWVETALSKPLGAAVHWYRGIDPISDRERAIVEVERHLLADAERGATLISVAYEAKSPKLAQEVCAALVDVYQTEHMRVQRSAASSPFFEEQQELLRSQLDHSLEAVRAAKNEMGLSDIDQRRATLEAQFSSVELDRLATQQQLATSQARAETLEKQLAQVPERLVSSTKQLPNVGADLLRDQLYSLEVKSMELQSRYTAKHPKVQAVNEQLKEAQDVVDVQSDARTETTADINPIHRQLALELKQEWSTIAGLHARLTELAGQTKVVLAALRQLNASELRIDQLTRDADLARDKFFQYAKNLEESRIDRELQRNRISNLSILEPASLNERPVSPSKPLVATATLMLAAAGTCALVAVSEWLHSSPVSIAGSKNGVALDPAYRNRVRHRVVEAKSNGQTVGKSLPH